MYTGFIYKVICGTRSFRRSNKVINNLAWIDWNCMLEMDKLKKKTDLPEEV